MCVIMVEGHYGKLLDFRANLFQIWKRVFLISKLTKLTVGT